MQKIALGQAIQSWRNASLKGCVASSHTLGTNNPNVQTITYNQAGHFLYREYPDLFNKDLISFIEYWADRRKR